MLYQVHYSPELLPQRKAAKIILKDPDGKIVLVAGESNRFNLPGGSIDRSERPRGALLRELREELSIESDHLGKIKRLKQLSALVSSVEGTRYRAVWHLYEAQLKVPTRELVRGSEIGIHGAFDRQTILNQPHERVSELAKLAIELFTTE